MVVAPELGGSEGEGEGESKGEGEGEGEGEGKGEGEGEGESESATHPLMVVAPELVIGPVVREEDFGQLRRERRCLQCTGDDERE
jgi:hypothetical protein